MILSSATSNRNSSKQSIQKSTQRDANPNTYPIGHLGLPTELSILCPYDDHVPFPFSIPELFSPLPGSPPTPSTLLPLLPLPSTQTGCRKKANTPAISLNINPNTLKCARLINPSASAAARSFPPSIVSHFIGPSSAVNAKTCSVICSALQEGM